VLVIPIFLVLKSGNLINTYWALILPTAANGFGIFLMRQYFVTIPVIIVFLIGQKQFIQGIGTTGIKN
jgi:ABC-type glycerol-3-phosphate transport system permease component